MERIGNSEGVETPIVKPCYTKFSAFDSMILVIFLKFINFRLCTFKSERVNPHWVAVELWYSSGTTQCYALCLVHAVNL